MPLLPQKLAQELPEGVPEAGHKAHVKPGMERVPHQKASESRGKMWSLSSDLVVLLDGEILGGAAELLNYLSSKFKLSIKRDFHKLGVIHLREIIQQTVDAGRRFVYMTIAVDFKVIGTLLILLYADLVPRTVTYFLKCCRRWTTTKINRIVQRCWIQGVMLRKAHRRPCENYIVPHDRRGVLSTCNSSKHTDNTCHFNISLNPTPWMDYKYVAFGQVIHGDEVLAFIENVPTCYEKPTKDIEITACGEFILDEDVDERTIKELEAFLSVAGQVGRMVNVTDVRDVPSELSITKYMEGLYAFPMDTIPYMLISRYLKTIYEEYDKHSVQEEQDEKEEGKEANKASEQIAEREHSKEQVEGAEIFLSRKDLRFKSDIYRKSDVSDMFRIEDISPTKRLSDVEESVIPAVLPAPSEHAEMVENQYNALYLD